MNAENRPGGTETASVGSGEDSTRKVSAERRSLSDFHRADLHASAITDEAMDAAGLWSSDTGRGWVLPWSDGVETINVAIPDRDKRRQDRKGKPMKVEWPAGRTTFLGLVRGGDGDAVAFVEGPRQALAAASYAPAGMTVYAMNGCRGIHDKIADRLPALVTGKHAFLILDGDHQSNDDVKAAARKAAELLAKAGARSVRLVDLSGLVVEPNDGLDDVLARTVEDRRAAVLAARIEHAEPIGGAVTAASRLEGAFYELASLENLPAPEPLLTGLLDRSTVNVLAGRFGTYKSFVALSVSACLATGRQWGPHAVPEPMPVIYVAAEGARGIRQRLAAWQEKHGPIPSGRLYVVTRPVHMTSDDDAEWLRTKVREVGAGLVVIDTWRQSTPGAEENSNTDMSAAFSRAASIRSDTGAAVLILHHTGHAGERSRGASSIEDDADSTFVIKRDGEDTSLATPRVMEHRKAKDTEVLEPFALVAEEVGGSLVVEPDAAPFTAAQPRKRGRPKDLGWGKAVETFADALDAAGLPLDTGYREALRWSHEHGSDYGIARFTEPIAREAVKLRRERAKESDKASAEGAEARNPSRGGGSAPHSPEQCGGNADDLPPRLSPAETPTAEAAELKAGGFTSAPSEAGAEVIITSAPAAVDVTHLSRFITERAAKVSPPVCPDCDKPEELTPAGFWYACPRCHPDTFTSLARSDAR